MSTVLITSSTIGPLITQDRASQNATLAALADSNPAGLDALIKSASDKIRRVCRRNFNVADYIAYYDGMNYPYDTLYIKNFPILQITRLATTPTLVMNVANTSSTVQRATVAVNVDGVLLNSVSSGVNATAIQLNFATYVTVQAMANAITLQGNGWNATPVTGYELFASADFKIISGALTAKVGVGAPIEIFTEQTTMSGVGSYIDISSPWLFNQGWRVDQDKGMISGVFPPSRNQACQNIRVDYTGGFVEVPDAIQEAAILTILYLMRAEKINFSLKMAKLGRAAVELAEPLKYGLPQPVMSMLSEYIDWGASKI